MLDPATSASSSSAAANTNTRRFVAQPSTLLVFDQIAHLCRAISASSSTAIYQLSPRVSTALADLYVKSNRAQHAIPPIGLERRVMSVTAATQAAVAAQRFPVAIARETVLLQVRCQRVRGSAGQRV